MLINIPDDQIKVLLDDYCAANGYMAQVSDNVGGWLPNPEDQMSFFYRLVLKAVNAHIGSGIMDYKRANMLIQEPVINISVDQVVKPV